MSGNFILTRKPETTETERDFLSRSLPNQEYSIEIDYLQHGVMLDGTLLLESYLFYIRSPIVGQLCLIQYGIQYRSQWQSTHIHSGAESECAALSALKQQDIGSRRCWKTKEEKEKKTLCQFVSDLTGQLTTHIHWNFKLKPLTQRSSNYLLDPSGFSFAAAYIFLLQLFHFSNSIRFEVLQLEFIYMIKEK